MDELSGGRRINRQAGKDNHSEYLPPRRRVAKFGKEIYRIISD